MSIRAVYRHHCPRCGYVTEHQTRRAARAAELEHDRLCRRTTPPTWGTRR